MSVSQNWRLERQRYRLQGEECPHCGAKIFPPRDACPECAKPAQEPYTFVGKGEIYSYTTVIDGPLGFEYQSPYVVALVKLDEGPIITTQLTDLEGEPEIGMRVEMVTRKLRTDGDEGVIVYGYKFRPLLLPEA
ncbi:MAG: Zn-ribbon domain-containing OB-fold protein [Anaerolineae bacterium]|nr:Zn-ribbon domain-containing OB-fold protein [Anaerolineae bacterium]